MLSSGLSAQFIVLCSAAAYIEHSLLGPSSNLRTTSQNFVLSQRLLDGRTVCLSDIAWFCRREVLSEVRLDNQLRSRFTLGDILSNRFVRYTTKPTLSRRHYRPHPGSDCRSDSGDDGLHQQHRQTAWELHACDGGDDHGNSRCAAQERREMGLVCFLDSTCRHNHSANQQ